MRLQFHNQLTKSIEPFEPQLAGQVSLYTCGPTVYDRLHVGNWAAYIYWDTLVRVLEANDLKVNRVMNITDVGHLTSDEDEGEDKLEKGARREGKTAWDVAQFYTDDFLDGMRRLGLHQPTHLTKATDFIPQQLELVRILKERGYTYVIDDGIYFDTAQFPTYGEFAGLDLIAQKAGARVEYNPQKRNASDFALWKFTPAGEKRDMEWDTPADLIDSDSTRPGFPGWHLECSAMAMSLLGETIDIHTGGIDHIPVHHTNEIAQSEAATGKLFSRFWLHNNHLKVDGTKISKSLQNGYTLDDLEARGFSPLDFRMLILQSSYHNEGNFTFEGLEAAQHRLLNWKNMAALRHQTHDTLQRDTDKERRFYAASGAILEAVSRDLDTPEAFRLIDDVFTQIANTGADDINRHSLVEILTTIDRLFGLQLLESTPDISDELKQKIITRERAREDKDWARSDELRAEIEKSGITLRDTAQGTIWEYSR